jgi:hypothetical protein
MPNMGRINILERRVEELERQVAELLERVKAAGK